MSTLENVIIYGNIDLRPALTTSDQGDGDIYIARNTAISGTTVSTSYTSGALTVAGGFGIGGAVFANSTVNVTGLTSLNQTSINTNSGALSVTGSNNISLNVTGAIQAQAAATSYLQTSSGNMTVASSSGSLSLNANTSLSANVSAGGINMTAAAASSFTTTLGNMSVSSPGTTAVSGNTALNLVSSSGSVSIDGSAASYFTVTGSFPLTISSTAGQTHITSGQASVNAVNIDATNAAGGISLTAGTTGINGSTTGPAIFNAQNAASNFSLATNASSQNLTFALSGATNSSLIVSSAGTGSSAISISSTSTTGGVSVSSGTGGISETTTGAISLNAAGTSNFTTSSGNLSLISSSGSSILQGAGTTATAVAISSTSTSGGVSIISGTAGISEVSTGPVSINAAGTSNFTTTGLFNLTLKTTGGNAILEGGSNSSNAVIINTTDTAGGITMTSGTSGISETTTGGISLNAVTLSNFTVASAADNQNLTLQVTGATNSHVNILSSGTSTSAVNIQSSSGGITANASTGGIALQTSDTTAGIKIGTTTVGTPISIGNATTSTVTIGRDMVVSGNLTVSGVTTTINTTTVTVSDNIVVYNSAPAGTADSGLAIKRYQTVNGSSDDIVSDTPNETSATHGGPTQSGTTSTTIKLNAGASAVTSYYNGWWIKITSGTHTGNVRRIRSYNGTTKVATIYGTADSDPSYPTDNLDFASLLTDYDGKTYSLYGNVFIASVYHESTDRWILCSIPLEPAVSSVLSPLKYINFQCGDVYSAGTVYTDNISGYTGTSVVVSGVAINNGALTGVISINGNTPDSVTLVTLPDSNTTEVVITSTATTGCYFILVKANYAGGAMAQFNCAKALASDNNTPNRIISSVGTNGERITLTWSATNVIKLKFQTNPGTASTYPYYVKVISP